MLKIRLTATEKTNLEKRHHETKDVIELDRIKAVLLGSERWGIAAIAQALRVHESTVKCHIKDYVEEGKLNFTKGGSNSLFTIRKTN